MGKLKLNLIVFIVAAAALNTWQLVLPNFHFDNSFCLAAAKNVADGNGYTIRRVFADDVSTVVYDPLNKWPPGYSWLVVGVMTVSHAGVITSAYIVNGMVVLFFLAGIYLILAALTFRWREINGFILFAGFFPYAFMGTWFADLAGVSFFTLAIGLILQAHNSGRHLYGKAIAAALLCGYCIFLKYLYLPVAILPMIVWGWYSLKNKNRAQLRAALAGSVIIMISAVGLLAYQSLHSGQPVYVNQTGKGFFPEHLLHVGPLIPASIIDQEFLAVQMDHIPFLSYAMSKQVLVVLNYLLLAGLIFWIYKWWKQTRAHSLYSYIVVVVTAATAALLMFLSVTFGPYLSEFNPFWTYVEELRYYAIVIVFLQIWLFWYFIVRKPQQPGMIYRVLRAALIIAVLIGTLHSAYYLVKQAIIKREAGTNKKNEQVSIAALRAVEELRKKYPDLIVCSNRQELANMVSLSGAPVLYDYDALNGPLKTRKPVVLVAILHNDFLYRFYPFLQRYDPVKLGEHYDFSFYLANIR